MVTRLINYYLLLLYMLYALHDKLSSEIEINEIHYPFEFRQKNKQI